LGFSPHQRPESLGDRCTQFGTQDTRENILDLVASGKVTADKGDQLPRALKPERNKVWRGLFCPIGDLSSATLWTIAVVAPLLCAGLASLRFRFNRALDLHIVQDDLTWTHALADPFVVWSLTAVTFWGIARLVAKEGRVIDAVVFPCLGWFPTLLANGVCTASGLSGGNLAAVLVPGSFSLSCFQGSYWRWRCDPHTTSLPNAPEGEYVVMAFATDFGKAGSKTEMVTTVLEEGQWKVVGYFVR
jgi:hypothetical protein